VRRRLGLWTTLNVVALVILGCLPFVLPKLAIAQAGGAHCQPGRSPELQFGIKALADRLGAPMGSPVECEHVDAESGDTIQHTTTGLAYYRPSINTAIFTDGSTHWALTADGLVLWRNQSVTPPRPGAVESAYLQKVAPLRSRASALDRRLASVRQQAERGQLDAVDVASLRSLVDELKATRDAFVAARAAGRLSLYNGYTIGALNANMGAAEMLAQARQIESPDLRARFLSSATKHRQESDRLRQAALTAYSKALPIAAD
jgi:hypothetical protein